MFSHDPFQHYQTLGAYGTGIPYGLPVPGIHTNIHPLAYATNPFAAYSQIPTQLPMLNPLTPGLQNPLLQHPLAHAAWQNPLASPLLNPWVNPLLAYQQTLAQQMFQPQTPFTYPLAPQSLVGGIQGSIGQPGIGQPGMNPQLGQINPLAQLALRQSIGGFSPFVGY